MASLLSWLGGAAKKVKDVAEGVERQVNPFDNGATYSNPTPARTTPAPPSLVSQARSVVAPTVKGIGGFLTSAEQVASILPNDARAITGIATGNDAATQAALDRAKQGVETAKSFARAPLQAGTRVALSAVDALTPGNAKTVRPTNAVERVLLGNDPIESYRGEFNRVKQQDGTPAAAGQLLATVGGDVGSLKGGIESVDKIKAALPEAIDAYHANPVLASEAGSVPIPGKSGVPDIPSGPGVPKPPTPVPQTFKVVRHSDSPQVGDHNYFTTDPELFKSKGANKIEATVKLSNPYRETPGEPALLDPQKAADLASKGYDGWVNSTGKIVVPFSKDSVEVGNVTGAGLKERGLTKGIKKSDEFTPELKAAVKSAYAPFTDKEAVGQTQKFMEQGLPKAHKQVLSDLSGTSDKDLKAPAGKQLVSNAGEVLHQLDAAGKTDEANTLHDLLGKRLTESGQTSQAAKLLYNRTPDGLYFKALKDLKSEGVDLNPELQAKLQAARDVVKAAADGTPEHYMAVQKLKDIVARSLPSTLKDKGVGIWKAGLLTGLKTVTKISTSYAVDAPLRTAGKVVAAGVDKAASLVTGKRALTLTADDALSGTARGGRAAITKVKTGLDEQHTGGFEGSNHTNYKNKIVQAYADGPGRVHGAIAKPVFGGFFDNSIADQAKAAAINAGKKGADRRAFIDEFKKDPPQSVLDRATREAQQATNQQITAGGKLAATLQKHGVLGQLLVPFTRIPAAIGTKGLIDYTPIGPLVEVYKQVRAGHFDQRSLDLAIGNATAGSAAGLGLGALLMSHGRLTTSYPTDPKERALWDLEGKKANSVKVGNHWLSIAALGPIGITLVLGGAFQKGLQDNQGDMTKAATEALAQGGKTLVDQPYLKGIAGAANALNNPTQEAASFLESTVGSIIPTIGAETAQALDPNSRQVTSIPTALENRIPGAKNTLPVRMDAYGRPIPEETGAGAYIDPFSSSSTRDSGVNTVTQELQRLQTNGVGALSQATKAMKVNGQNMTQSQLNTFIKSTGPEIEGQLADIIKSPDYQALGDDDKSKVITNAISDIRSAGKITALGDNPKSVSGAVKQLIAGGGISVTSPLGISDKLDSASKKTLVDYNAASDKPAYKTAHAYDLAVANYRNNVANGKIKVGSTEDFTAKQAINKLSVTSKYSPDVNALYSMSKANRAAALAQFPDLAGLMPQVAQLSADLASKRFTSSDKIAAGSKAKKTPAKVTSELRGSISAINKLLGSKSTHAFHTPRVRVAKAKKSRAKVKTRIT